MFVPPTHILENYARVLVRFALGGGKGIKKGDTVYLVTSEAAKPLFMLCRREILKAGGNVITNYMPATWERYQFDRDFYELASPAQLDWFPQKYMKGLIDEIDHFLYIVADENPHSLDGIDSKKIMRKGKAFRPFMDWRFKKEHAGKFTWTLCVYGTPAMAREAGLSEKEYWQQIINACYLDAKDPIKEWKHAFKMLGATKRKLDALTPTIDELHIEGEDVDLWVTPGETRQWLAGSGRNIPSFEIFTTPDCRETEGWIRFNQPLLRYGNRIEGIELWFEKGRVIKSKATKNEKVLKAMIATEGADRVGEFSLTDKRLSRITKFMAHTIFDENMGGPYGNTHVALGFGYPDAYTGDLKTLTPAKKKRLGINDSSVHTDMFSTTDRIVTAHLKDGSTKVIYKDGMFVL